MRAPPNDIQMLLPVWGERYTRDFLDFCLPSLLAPGNIPALSKLAPCALVLLTPARNAAIIQQSPLWGLLLRHCEVRIEPIDDLVSESSSTVLTLAYALAIRKSGEQALDTCFVPLVADYVLSDGSLVKVVERIFAGTSGVLAGNFQIEREAAVLGLEASKDNAGVLTVAPRALVEISFGALHQATLAQTVDAGNRYDPHTNRLFWRVDDHCMVGRFFLMHMIAIRPEIHDFVIAASSDYSLIPELCPSGEVVRMMDSDDYFVVECQPRGSQLPTPSAGPLDARSVANGLASWATALHRENARHALVFHGGPHPARLRETIALSETFVSKVDAHCTKAPMPFRHHPLWTRALEHHAATALMEQDPVRLAAITADPETAAATGLSGFSRWRLFLLGRAPYFRPWHPRWMDARALQQRLSTVAANGKVAVVADVPARVRLWLERGAFAAGALAVTHIPTAALRADADGSSEGGHAFDCCVFLASDVASAELPGILSRLAPLVGLEGAIVLCVGQIFSDTVSALPSIVPPPELALANGRLKIEAIYGLSANPSRITVQRAMMQFARNFSGLSSIASVLSLLPAAGLAAISLCFNKTRVAQVPAAGRLPFTSLFLTFRRSPIETIGGERYHRHDQPAAAIRAKGGDPLSKSPRTLNSMSKELGWPIYSLRTAASTDAATFAMRGRR
jgi:hypothetical protein